MSAPCLALDSSGRAPAVPLRLVAGPEAVAVKVRMRLDSIRGSWLEDERIGLPWTEWVEAPATPAVVIEGAVRAQCREVPGVRSVDRVTATKTGGDLRIDVTLTVDSDVAGPVRVHVQSDADDASPGAWWLLLHTPTMW